MADWNDPAFWLRTDRVREGKPTLPDGSPNPNFGRILSYLDGRVFANAIQGPGWTDYLHEFRQRLNKLGSVPNFTPSTNVLVVGCGFGWLMETMMDLGANRVWGTDISTVIQGLLDDPGVDVRTDVRARILAIDVTDPQAVQQFRTAGAGGQGANRGKFDWIITELVMESFDPVNDLATFTGFLDSLDGLRTNQQGGVAHIVAHHQENSGHDDTLGMTWLTLAEWAALQPAHWWIDVLTGEVAGGQ